MRVSHFFECLSDGDCCLGVDEEGPQFRFGRGGHNSFDDLGDIELGTIIRGVLFVGRKEVVSSRLAPGINFGEIGGVGVDVEHHVTCAEG